MCNQILTWARKVTVGGQTKKSVFLLLADYADEKGRAWPSQETIAATLEMSERTVRSAIKELVDAGLLSRKPRWRPDGTRGTDILRFDMEMINRQELPVMAEQPANGAETTGKSRQINRQMVPELPAGDAGKSSQGEPLEGKHHQNVSEATASDGRAVAVIERPIADVIWTDGVVALTALGESEKAARTLVGQLRKQAGNDDDRVWWAIQQAVAVRTGDPRTYCLRLLLPKTERPAGKGRRAGMVGVLMADYGGLH